MNPITGNIITDIGAILQNKHVNMSNNNITRSYLGWGYLFTVFKLQIILDINPKCIRAFPDMKIENMIFWTCLFEGNLGKVSL